MNQGPRGIGKTHVTLGVACAIASGGTFLGWRAVAAFLALQFEHGAGVR
jgi:hypothetical protein